MTKPSPIDWHEVQTKLKNAFDDVAKQAAEQAWPQHRSPHYDAMIRLTDAMVKASAEARAVQSNDKFSINKG